MMFSKFAPIQIDCKQYVHPWTDSCFEATMGVYIQSIIFAIKLYGSIHLFVLLIKGRIPPRRNDIKNSCIGILESTAFLSGFSFGYSVFLCTLRRLLGNFNILTASSIPAFLATFLAIIIQRPSRRTFLTLYMSNIATETIWNMLVYRKLVKSVPYGQVAIFAISISVLLTIYKSGLYVAKDEKKIAPTFKILRFIIGKYEDNLPNQTESYNDSSSETMKKNTHLCPHPFGCLYYTLQGTTKMFLFGLSIEFVLKLVLNGKVLLKNPKKFFEEIIYRRDTIKLGSFLAGFCGLFRAVSCLLRKTTGKDSCINAIPAGLLAGIAFSQYPNNTIALSVMWKTLHIAYNLGIDYGYVAKVPGFNTLLCCCSITVLIHASILEPQNLRLSYWKFLYNSSAGRVACIDRTAFEPWGLGTLEGLAKTIEKAKTPKVIHYTGIEKFLFKTK